jgi:hypothetical protein
MRKPDGRTLRFITGFGKFLIQVVVGRLGKTGKTAAGVNFAMFLLAPESHRLQKMGTMGQAFQRNPI